MTSSKTISYNHGARITERARQNNPWNEPLAPSVARSKPTAIAREETATPMREASIILPLTNNDGENALDEHAFVVSALLDDFGGFTEENVSGQWRDDENGSGKIYRDKSVRYTVAASASSQNQNYLEAIARQACAGAKQICIYVRGFDGIVRFVKP